MTYFLFLLKSKLVSLGERERGPGYGLKIRVLPHKRCNRPPKD